MSQLVNMERSSVLYLLDGGPKVTCKSSNKANFASRTIACTTGAVGVRERGARGTQGEGREKIST